MVHSVTHKNVRAGLRDWSLRPARLCFGVRIAHKDNDAAIFKAASRYCGGFGHIRIKLLSSIAAMQRPPAHYLNHSGRAVDTKGMYVISSTPPKSTSRIGMIERTTSGMGLLKRYDER
jgi:hypothetical protein